MIGPLGGPELFILLILVFVFFLGPFFVLARVSANRGRSLAWALLGAFSWIGAAVGLAILLSAPTAGTKNGAPPADFRGF